MPIHYASFDYYSVYSVSCIKVYENVSEKARMYVYESIPRCCVKLQVRK
jgi:hypothetical protein